MGGAAIAVGSAVVGGIAQSKSADKAAKAQEDSSEAAIAEDRRQFDKVVELLAPYVDAGNRSLTQQQALLGLLGPEEQTAAIRQVRESPAFAAVKEQGELAILQNASATGGLRGGNTQRLLAEFRPQALAGLIDQQLGRLGGISGLGQASAAGTGAAAQQSAANIGGFLTQAGQAQAGSALAQGQAFSNLAQTVGNVGFLQTLRNNQGGGGGAVGGGVSGGVF